MTAQPVVTDTPAWTVSRARPSTLNVWLACVCLLAILSLPLAVFGVRQLAGTTRAQLDGPAQVTDFLAYYSAARLVLTNPSNLYDPDLQRSIQRDLQGGGEAFVPFVSPPHVPLIQAPLALLPYGQAYLLWGVLSLVCLAVSALLLAPRPFGGRAAGLVWLAIMPLFLPVLFGLIMGQSSALMLLGFCAFARLSLNAHRLRGGLALLSWTIKPNMLPTHIAALLCARRWRTLAAGSTAILLVAATALFVIGIHGAAGLVRASTTRIDVATARPDGYPEGFTFLPIAQSLAGVGTSATVLTLLAGAMTCAAIGIIWRRGLAQDARRYLQLALLPIAATLASVHAGVYELTTWLASAWLLLEYARLRPRRRGPVMALILTAWAAGNLAVIGQTTSLLPVMCAVGALIFASVLTLYVVDSRRV